MTRESDGSDLKSKLGMRVLVWNMQGVFGATSHEAKWNYLELQDFDVALLQEARDPARYADWCSAVWRPKHAESKRGETLWGSAVISRSMDLEEPELDESYPWLGALEGSTAIARTPGDPTWFASVHALAGRIPDDKLNTLPHDHIPRATPDGSLWETDVIPFELRKLFGDQTFVWGGDLNSAEGMDDVTSFAGGNRQLRMNWKEAGSYDLRRGSFEEEQQTFFRLNTKPWQIDHVFADAATRDRVSDWRVDAAPAIEYKPPLSDHAPIFVEIEPS